MGGQEVEYVESTSEAETNVRIHAKAIIVILCINFVYFAQLVAVVGSGFLAQPITELLGGSNQTVWFSSVITILTVALSPPVTQAADYWGRKWLLISSTTLGFLGALIVSRAQWVNTVIAGFTIMGCCYGAQPLLHAVVSEILPRKHRPVAQATVNISAGTGGITGILMGGGLLRHGNLENFRIYLYVVAGIFAAATIGTIFCYNPPIRELQKNLTLSEKLRKLDWIGYFLFVPGLVLFCMSLSWYENPYQFSSARILSTFIIGIIFVIAFFVYEWRFKKDGVLHHDLFRNRNFAISILCVFVEGLAFFAANSYFVYEVSLMTGDDILISGLHFCVFFASAIISSFLGLPFFMLFNILLATTTPHTRSTVYWGYPIIAGAGMGMLLPVIMVAAQLSTPPELISTTSGLVVAARSLRAAVGLAVNNALFHKALATNIPTKIAAATLPLGLPQSSLGQHFTVVTGSNTTAIQNVHGATTEIIEAAEAGLIEAYSIAFRSPWIAAACFSFVAVISSLFIFDPREEFTAHIDAPAEKDVDEAQARVGGVKFVPDGKEA